MSGYTINTNPTALEVTLRAALHSDGRVHYNFCPIERDVRGTVRSTIVALTTCDDLHELYQEVLMKARVFVCYPRKTDTDPSVPNILYFKRIERPTVVPDTAGTVKTVSWRPLLDRPYSVYGGMTKWAGFSLHEPVADTVHRLALFMEDAGACISV
jgi:hypothetical protein